MPRLWRIWGHPHAGSSPVTQRAIPASPPRVYLIPREISRSLMVQGGPMASRESSDSVVVHRAPCPRSWEKLSQRAKALISPAESHATPRNRCYGPRSTATGRKELKEINLVCLAHLGLPPALLSTLRGGRGGAAPTQGTPDSVPSSTTDARCGCKEKEVPGGVTCFREAAALHPAPFLPCGQQPPAPAPRVAGICNRPAGEPDPQQRPGNHLKHEDKSSSRSVNKLVPTTLYNLTRTHKEWEGGGRRVPVAASAWRCRSTSRWWR